MRRELLVGLFFLILTANMNGIAMAQDLAKTSNGATEPVIGDETKSESWASRLDRCDKGSCQARKFVIPCLVVLAFCFLFNFFAVAYVVGRSRVHFNLKNATKSPPYTIRVLLFGYSGLALAFVGLLQLIPMIPILSTLLLLTSSSLAVTMLTLFFVVKFGIKRIVGPKEVRIHAIALVVQFVWIIMTILACLGALFIIDAIDSASPTSLANTELNKNIRIAAIASIRAYWDNSKAEGSSDPNLERCGGRTLQDEILITDSATSTEVKVMTLRNNDNTVSHVMVAFRGTYEFAKDIRMNMSFSKTPDGLCGQDTMIHTGFFQAYEHVRTQLRDYLRAHHDIFVGQGGQEPVFIVTGHSLGGALSTLFAYDMACNIPAGSSEFKFLESEVSLPVPSHISISAPMVFTNVRPFQDFLSPAHRSRVVSIWTEPFLRFDLPTSLPGSVFGFHHTFDDVVYVEAPIEKGDIASDLHSKQLWNAVIYQPCLRDFDNVCPTDDYIQDQLPDVKIGSDGVVEVQKTVFRDTVGRARVDDSTVGMITQGLSSFAVTWLILLIVYTQSALNMGWELIIGISIAFFLHVLLFNPPLTGTPKIVLYCLNALLALTIGALHIRKMDGKRIQLSYIDAITSAIMLVVTLTGAMVGSVGAGYLLPTFYSITSATSHCRCDPFGNNLGLPACSRGVMGGRFEGAKVLDELQK